MMFAFVKGFIEHCKEALSEDGVGSYSRYCGAGCVVASVIWVSYVVIRTHAIPELGGVTGFIAGGNSAYLGNQVKRVAAAIKGVQSLPQENQNG